MTKELKLHHGNPNNPLLMTHPELVEMFGHLSGLVSAAYENAHKNGLTNLANDLTIVNNGVENTYEEVIKLAQETENAIEDCRLANIETMNLEKKYEECNKIGNQVCERLNGLQDEVNELQKKLETANHDIDYLEDQEKSLKVKLKDSVALQSKVANLESENETLQNRVELLTQLLMTTGVFGNTE